MDNGPFRVPRPASRPEPIRPEPLPEPVDEPKPPVVKQEPKTVHRPNTASRFEIEDKKRRNKFILPIVGVVVAIVLGILGWTAWSSFQNSGTAIDGGKYQAVFFTNGQVYFGKLKSFNSDYMKLTEVFYLQAKAEANEDSENPQQASTDQNNTTLIKLGDEIHGPEDEMVISKEQILFYENLKADGKVASTIDQYNKTKK